MKILDLFCGAGGASMGYHRVFPDAEIVGVDINPQPRYPFTFVRGDALEFPLDGFDFVHASPPCQRFSSMSKCRPGLERTYLDLIAPIRTRLREPQWCRCGCNRHGRCVCAKDCQEHPLRSAILPYVIENVVGAPLLDSVVLCGTMFGLELYRHRLFECSFRVPVPEHPDHVLPASRAGHWVPGTVMSVAGHVAPMAKAREVMGIDWMTRDELTESIPPVYTEWIGLRLRDFFSCS
jgi:DNA (cytosine-5)-methyltransferase 1